MRMMLKAIVDTDAGNEVFRRTPCMTLEDIKKGVEEATRRMSSMEG